MTHNVAVVGCGSMGVGGPYDSTFPFTYNHAAAVLKNPDARLVALVDTDSVKLEAAAKKLRGGGYQTNFTLHQTLESATSLYTHAQRIDVVCCAAGPEANAEVITKAQDLGIRGVYCDKPMTLSLPEADRLAALETSSGLKVQVNYLRNFDPCHRAVIEYIRNGGIGNLLFVRILYKGGVLGVAPHALALLQLLFEKALMVSGIRSPLINGRAPDDLNVDGAIRYYYAPEQREVNVSLTATGRGEIDNDTYLFEFEFTGTKARVSILESGWRIRYEPMERSRIFGALGEMMPYDSACVPLALKADAPREFMIDGLKQLLNAVDHDTPTSAGAALARDAEEVAHALALSAIQEGRTMHLPLTDRSHVFKHARAGTDLLAQEAGIKK